MREQFLAKYGFNDGEASLMITEANIYGWKTGEASAEAVKLFGAIRRGQSGQKAEVVAARLESEQRRRIEAAIVQVQSHLRPEAEPRLTALLRHVKDEDGSSGTASRQSMIRGVC